jgi:hypothetical protein
MPEVSKENIKLNFIHCQQESETCDPIPNLFIKRHFLSKAGPPESVTIGNGTFRFIERLADSAV